MSTESTSASAEPATPKEVDAAAIQRARSITVLVHGIGDSSSDSMLESAAEGYRWSGLGTEAARGFLSECPSLRGDFSGCECILLGPEDARHIVVALPWSERRLRLTTIANAAAGWLLAMGVLLFVAFFVRGPLTSIANLLDSWPRQLMAYAVLFALAALFHLGQRKRFEPPPFTWIILPGVLVVLLSNLYRATWLWVPISALIGLLWLGAMITLIRSLVASTVELWSLAIVCLVSGLTVCSTGLVLFTWNQIGPFASARYYEGIEDNRASTVVERMLRDREGTNRHEDFEEPYTPRSSNLDFDPEASDAAARTDTSAQARAPRPAPTSGIRLGRDGRPLVESNESTRESTSIFDPMRDQRSGARIVLEENSFRIEPVEDKPKPHRKYSNPALTWSEFWRSLLLLVVCLGLCLIAKFWHWPLDLLLDVLHYTGSRRHREWLLKGTSRTLRWLHKSAPEATLIIIGHSLGSVIVTHTLDRQAESEPFLKRAVLVTLGSPLAYMSRIAPESVRTITQLGKSICERMRWINLWRSADPIGRSFAISTFNFRQHCVAPGGHNNYWAVGAVWKAVAKEALEAGDAVPVQTADVRDTPLLERHLVLAIGALVILISFIGVGLWIALL